jgi:uracil-DNA glycosylase
MLVGQAPGKVEVSGGRPFAGRAGHTLFRWLERAGIDEDTARRRIYIAAVTRCFPGPSPSGRGDRVPSRAEQAACGEWLDAELRIIRPKLLIPVGRLAIARFLPDAPLDRIIGRAHPVSHAGGETTAIPLPHPSGASSWIHQADHAELVERALALIGRALLELGIASGGGPVQERPRATRRRREGAA